MQQRHHDADGWGDLNDRDDPLKKQAV